MAPRPEPEFEDVVGAGPDSVKALEKAQRFGGVAKGLVETPRSRVRGQQPPAELGEAFAQVYRRVLPETPFARAPRDPMEAYNAILEAVAGGIRATGEFSETEMLRSDWEHPYTTDEWVEQVPTFGGHNNLAPETLDQLLSGIRFAIDTTGSTSR